MPSRSPRSNTSVSRSHAKLILLAGLTPNLRRPPSSEQIERQYTTSRKKKPPDGVSCPLRVVRSQNSFTPAPTPGF